MPATYIGTTHNSPKSGHGPKVRRQRSGYERSSGVLKGGRTRGQSSAEFLKAWGSRPPKVGPTLSLEGLT